MTRSAFLALRLAVFAGVAGVMTAALPLAAQPADPAACAGTRSGVDISQLTVEETALQAAGTWRVEGTEAGAMVEFRLDSDRMASETRSGGSGPWSFAFDFTGAFKKCGRHTLRVFTFPVVKDGGRLAHCLAKGESAAKTFTISCAPKARIEHCEWECSDDEPAGCTGVCAATARGGAPGLVGLQALNNQDYKVVEGPEGGPWSWPVACRAGERVSFKVRDQQGIGVMSNVAEILCGAPKPIELGEPQSPPTR